MGKPVMTYFNLMWLAHALPKIQDSYDRPFPNTETDNWQKRTKKPKKQKTPNKPKPRKTKNWGEGEMTQTSLKHIKFIQWYNF